MHNQKTLTLTEKQWPVAPEVGGEMMEEKEEQEGTEKCYVT